MRYLLDTNAVSDITTPTADPRLVYRFQLAKHLCAVASVVVDELRYGEERTPDHARRLSIRARYDVFLASMEVLPFDEPAALWAGRRRAELEAAGMPVARWDIMIAATAATQQRPLTVITHNTRDFARLNVRAEDWRT